MARSPLSLLQRQVRTELIKHGGRIGRQELADKLGCSRITIWRAICAIQKYRPIEEEKFVQADEIRRALMQYDELETNLLEELEQNESLISDAPSPSHALGFLNVRLGLLGQTRQVRQDRTKFLLDIGMLKTAPKELIISDRSLAETPDEDLAEREKALRREIMELEHGLSQETET